MAKKKPLADLEKKTHSQAKPLDWKELNALLISYPSKKAACDYIGCSDTHLDNELQKEFGLTWGQYKEIRLLDVVSRIKSAMINKALEGDVPAGKYVLSNIGDWSDKQEIKNTNTNMTVEEFIKHQSEKK